MSPKTDNLTTRKYKDLREEFADLLYKADDSRSILLEENRRKC